MITYKKFVKKFRTVSENLNEIYPAHISSSKDAYEFMLPHFEAIDVYESFWIAITNRANNIVGINLVSQGGIACTTVDIRLIGNTAVQSLASGVIIFHNHPSGSLKPSTQDIELTKKIKAGLNMLDINLLDHLIVTTTGYYSFADEGML